jgi:hypothetical protein
MSGWRAFIIAVLMVAATSALRAQTQPLPTGASAAFTSTDPVLREITRIISAGEFPSSQLVAKLNEPADDPAAPAARDEMKEILRRFRHE